MGFHNGLVSEGRLAHSPTGGSYLGHSDLDPAIWGIPLWRAAVSV